MKKKNKKKRKDSLNKFSARSSHPKTQAEHNTEEKYNSHIHTQQQQLKVSVTVVVVGESWMSIDFCRNAEIVLKNLWRHKCEAKQKKKIN